MNKIVKINSIEHKIIHSVKPHGETKKECKNLDFVEDYYLENDLMLVHNMDKNTYTLLDFSNYETEKIEIKTISF